MKYISTDEFEFEFATQMGVAYENIRKNKEEKPSGFIFSVARRYAEAYAQGARFFGPLTAIPKENGHWILKDLRGGWGYSPLDIDFYVKDNAQPTRADMEKALADRVQALEYQAENVRKVIASI